MDFQQTLDHHLIDRIVLPQSASTGGDLRSSMLQFWIRQYGILLLKTMAVRFLGWERFCVTAYAHPQ